MENDLERLETSLVHLAAAALAGLLSNKDRTQEFDIAFLASTAVEIAWQAADEIERRMIVLCRPKDGLDT